MMIKKNLGLEKDDEKGGDGVKRKNNNGMKWLLIKVNARTLSEWNGKTEKGGKRNRDIFWRLSNVWWATKPGSCLDYTLRFLAKLLYRGIQT